MRWWTTALVLLVGCGSTEAPTPPPEPVQTPVEVTPPSEADELEGEDEEDEGEDEEDEDQEAAGDFGTHDVIMLVVHEEPLLRSEQRIATVITERIHMRGYDIGQREASEEEAAFVLPQFESPEAEANVPVPASLAAASNVIVLRIPPPRELNDGQLATRGIAGVLIYRHGEQAPFFRSIVDDQSAWRNAEDVWSGWFLSLLRAEART